MWCSRVVATCKGSGDGLPSAPATVSDAASPQDALWRHQALSTSLGCLVNLTNDDLHEVIRCRWDDMPAGAREIGPARASIRECTLKRALRHVLGGNPLPDV